MTAAARAEVANLGVTEAVARAVVGRWGRRREVAVVKAAAMVAAMVVATVAEMEGEGGGRGWR